MDKKPFSDIVYEQYLNEDKLMGSQCKKCDTLFTPPRPICAECHSHDLQWVEMQGEGKLVGFTCITIGPAFMADEGYDRNNPYCVGVVDLEEGTRVDARIEGVDVLSPETIKVGLPLKIKFLHRGEGENLQTFLAFEPK